MSEPGLSWQATQGGRRRDEADLSILETFLYGAVEKRQAAFLEMVNKYRDRLYAVIYGMVRVHEDTDDILQEVFITAFEKLHTFRMDSSLFTWLCRIAMNRSVSWLRKKKLRRYLSLDAVFHVSGDDRDRPDEMTIRKEEADMIDDAIQTLPTQQKRIFVLRHVEGLSHAEIAQVLGRSEGAVKAGYFHALKKIQAYVEEKV